MGDIDKNSDSSRNRNRRIKLAAVVASLVLVVAAVIAVATMRSDRIPSGQGKVVGQRIQYEPVPTGPAGADLSTAVKPLPGPIEVLSGTAASVVNPVKSSQTGKDGKFDFTLPAGVYRIDGGSDDCLEQTVSVTPGNTLHVSLECRAQ